MMKAFFTDGPSYDTGSLGARLVVGMLAAIYASQERNFLLKITGVVFSAPDVDQRVMDQDFLPVQQFTNLRATIYVSNPDWMIRLSQFVSGRSRVGSAGSDVYLRPGVETIDVCAVGLPHVTHDVPRQRAKNL